MKADPNSSRMERSLLQGKTHSWKQELGKEKGALNDEGLHPKLRQAVGSLQIKGHKMEEPPKENLRLLDERDAPLLKQPGTMHQREGTRTYSMEESRSCTPKPQGAGDGPQRAAGDYFDHHAEEGRKEEKRALSLLGGARKVLKTAP